MSEKCSLCPRMCNADRSRGTGFCRAGDKIKVARAALHYWEEPCISGERGSGTVFFSNCTLGCVYCQNKKISREGFGREITSRQLADIFLELEQQGAENINLVTPTHFTPWILKALDMARPRLSIPVLVNTSGYERVETVKMWEGYADIYLPDLKYKSCELGKKYSNAADYFDYASKAILEMHRQQPKLQIENGILKRGMIIRHLVLPSCYKDSLQLLRWISSAIPEGGFYLSLMSQFVPNEDCGREPYTELNRKITTFEYQKVVSLALELGIPGFMQEKGAADEKYLPDFDLTGVL